MSKQLTTTPSTPQSLSTIESKLSTGKILKEQDKGDVIFFIGMLLHRIAKLWQIPNWNDDNAEALAEWIYDNYKFDSLATVKECLRNPKPLQDKTYRLTPDVIQEWMSEHQERAAIEREQEHQKNLITEKGIEPSESAKEFYRKNFFEFSGNVLNQPEKSKDQGLQDFKSEYFNKRMRENLEHPKED